MTTNIRRASAWMGFALLTAAPAVAAAQQSADDVEASATASYQAGHGLSISEELLLHPRLVLEAGFQSNVFFSNAGDPDEAGMPGDPSSSPLLRIGVGASLVNARPDSPPGFFVLTGDAQVTWNQYLSGQESISSRSDMGVAATLDAKWNSAGALSFGVRDVFTRMVTPPPAEFAEDVDRDKNRLAARLTAKPGGGAIEVYGELGWQVDFFESSTFNFANRNSFELKAGTKWQWLPKTQFTAEASLGLVFVDENAIRTDTGTALPLRVTVGTSTLITSKFGTVLRVGYGNSFQNDGFNSFLALAEARYSFGPMFKVAGGYSRDFSDSFLGNFRADHAIYARFAAQLQGKLQVLGKFETRFRNYGGIPMTAMGATFCADEACTPGAERNDLILRFTLEGQYQINDWLQAGAEFTQHTVDTEARIEGGPRPDSFAFSWSEVMATARVQF